MLTPPTSVDDVIRRHRAISRPIDARCLGHAFKAWPGVFSPLIAPSGYLELSFAAWPIFKSRTVLDVGSGSGISSCLFALAGARTVVGVDVNPAALEAGQANAAVVNVAERVSFRLGDVFDPVGRAEHFDVLFANLPFMTGTPADMLERAFYDPGLASSKRFLEGAADRLGDDPSVQVFLCTSDLEPSTLQRYAGRRRLRWETVLTIRLGWVTLRLVRVTLRTREWRARRRPA